MLTLTDHWILEIIGGGWMDLEKSRSFISDEIFNVREFLVEGIDDCISVLATKEPIIKPVHIES